MTVDRLERDLRDRERRAPSPEEARRRERRWYWLAVGAVVVLSYNPHAMDVLAWLLAIPLSVVVVVAVARWAMRGAELRQD